MIEEIPDSNINFIEEKPSPYAIVKQDKAMRQLNSMRNMSNIKEEQSVKSTTKPSASHSPLLLERMPSETGEPSKVEDPRQSPLKTIPIEEEEKQEKRSASPKSNKDQGTPIAELEDMEDVGPKFKKYPTHQSSKHNPNKAISDSDSPKLGTALIKIKQRSKKDSSKDKSSSGAQETEHFKDSHDAITRFS